VLDGHPVLQRRDALVSHTRERQHPSEPVCLAMGRRASWPRSLGYRVGHARSGVSARYAWRRRGYELQGVGPIPDYNGNGDVTDDDYDESIHSQSASPKDPNGRNWEHGGWKDPDPNSEPFRNQNPYHAAMTLFHGWKGAAGRSTANRSSVPFRRLKRHGEHSRRSR
jgi:hypothetical protein